MKLFYRILGENNNKNLIILHGLFGSSDNWLTMGKKFAENYCVYLLDLRNHGQSPHNNLHDYDVLTDDLKEFFDEHNISKSSLLGHSMGGKNVMNFSFSYPEKVEKLIVVDIAPKEYRTSNKFILERLLEFNLENIKTRDDADQKLSEKIPNKAVRQFILKNLKRNDDLSFSWRINLKVLNDNLNAMGGDFNQEKIFNGETLFLRGQNSNYIKENDFELIYKSFPNSIIETIENAGHWVHIDNPDQTYNKIVEFLLK